MVFSVIAAAVFGAVSLYMMMTSKAGLARRMAWIPLSMAAMELAMGGIIALGGPIVLTVIMMLCRVTVLSCCVAATKRDAAVVRNRRRRREVWRRVAYEMTAEVQAMPTIAPARRCA